MKIYVLGCGWIDNTRCGSLISKKSFEYAPSKKMVDYLINKGVFQEPVKNFSRFDTLSQQTIIAVALSLYDAGISYCADQKLDIGLLSSNLCGSLDSNLNYYDDYVKNGRTLGRGNIFIYTLPSSSLAEAAIHFKCNGPLMHLTFHQNPDVQLLEMAKRMIMLNEAEKICAIHLCADCIIGYMLGFKDSVPVDGDLEFSKILDLVKNAPDTGAILNALLAI